MAASRALTPLESVVRRAESRGDARDLAVRTQLALVRALIDESRRRSTEDELARALVAQLEEETARLARLINDEGTAPSPSSVRLRA